MVLSTACRVLVCARVGPVMVAVFPESMMENVVDQFVQAPCLPASNMQPVSFMSLKRGGGFELQQGHQVAGGQRPGEWSALPGQERRFGQKQPGQRVVRRLNTGRFEPR